MNVPTSANRSYNYDSDDDDSDDIPVLQPIQTVRQSILGQIRTCTSVTWLEWSFMALSVISITSGFAFNVYRMTMLPMKSDEYVFAIVVLVNLVFCVWYLLHGIFQEQPFEILMFVLTSLLLSLLITLNYAARDDGSGSGSRHLKLIRFIVTLILTLPNAAMGLKVGWKYWSSGNLVFKTVGGDMRLQRMCRTLFFGMSLLVFDAQAFISCLILIIERGLSELTNEDIVIITTGIAFTVLWLTIGYVAIRSENMHLVYLFFVTSLIQPMYAVYILVDGLHEIVENYSTIRTDSIFVAGTALILAHFSLLAALTVIASNFRKGLRSAVYGSEEMLHEGSSSSNNAPLIGDGGTQINYGTSNDVGNP